uniref:1-phosphatidylinositol-4-phosphate 5-kinase n=1 Tax=Blastobotrys adeninivorans TaxID=409370 RepID=A0A060SWW2_BLAAD
MLSIQPHQSTRSNPSSSTTDEENYRSNDWSSRSMSSLATTVESDPEDKNGYVDGSDVFYDPAPSTSTLQFKDTPVLLNVRPRKSPTSQPTDYFTNHDVQALRDDPGIADTQKPMHEDKGKGKLVDEITGDCATTGPQSLPENEATADSNVNGVNNSHNEANGPHGPNGLSELGASPIINGPSHGPVGPLAPETENGSIHTVEPLEPASPGTFRTPFRPPGRSSTDSRDPTASVSSLASAPPRASSLVKVPTHTSTTTPASPGTSYGQPRSSSAHTIHLHQQPQFRQNSAASATSAPRASMSSQISRTSSQRSQRNSVGENALARVSSSLSFVRRRSISAVANRLSTSSILDDNSASAQDIERLREAIIAHRESKRRRREVIEDERVLVGTKVSEGHVNYVTAYNMLTGIRVSVSRCNAKVDHELVDADFKARHKLAFDISGNELTPSARYDFKFKDYSPWVFRHLRALFKLDPADYLISLTSKYIVSELGSPGKSGSFFYFSRDYRFIIKTIHHSEHKMLRRILKDYYNHVKKYPNTLISQFYGLHRVKLPFGRKIHFIVMNNLFPAHRDIHRTYDLKGSTLGRTLAEEPDGTLRKSAVYKDMNWLRHSERIRLGPLKREQFLKQLEIDVALLKRLNIMDYSLLIGIHDLNIGNSERIRDNTLSVFDPEPNISKGKVAELRRALNSANPTALLSGLDAYAEEYRKRDFAFYADSGGFRATDEDNRPLQEIYYLGVIDCLTPYTFYKRVETFWKSLSHPRMAVSAIPAEEYGDRFFNFIKSIVTHPSRTRILVNKRTKNESKPKSTAKQTSSKPEGEGSGAVDSGTATPVTAPTSPTVDIRKPRDDGVHLPALTEASTETSAPISAVATTEPELDAVGMTSAREAPVLRQRATA